MKPKPSVSLDAGPLILMPSCHRPPTQWDKVLLFSEERVFAYLCFAVCTLSTAAWVDKSQGLSFFYVLHLNACRAQQEVAL